MLEELPKEYQMKKCLFCAKSLFGHFLPILTHIDKFSGHESGAFLENFSKKKFLLSYDVTMDDKWYESRGINRWRVGAPRHDIKVNLVCYLF